jgi:hypothetical protein
MNRIASTVTVGAATAAAAALPASQAAAQDAGFDVIVDGGVSFANFSENFFDEKGGAPFDVDTDKGFYGSVSISRQISDSWDWRVSGNVLTYGENETLIGFLDDDDDDDDDDGVTLTNSLTGITVDADVGKTMTMGQTQVRLGFGLLAADYKQQLDFGFGKVGFGTEIDYQGIGLKLSADVAHPVSADGRTKLIGGASIAPTSGEFTATASGLGDDDDDDSSSIDGDALLTSAYVGLSLQQNETTELRMGVRVDHFDGDIDEDGGAGIAGGSVTSTSAFIGMRVQF